MENVLQYNIVEHTFIPMPDKIRLSARLWVPKSAEASPVPVVLEYIPYRKRDSYRHYDDVWGNVLASQGIAFARVDVRGSGDSEGVLTDEYSETELQDGVECIDWLSKQSWCNGNVGMRGISWGAINTLQIASRQPPALKAIMPIAGMDNRFTDDAHYLGGLLGLPNSDWGTLFRAVMAGPPDPEIVGDAWETMWRERLSATPAILTKWLQHQRFDSYWQRGSIMLDYAAIRCPVYVVAGWLDTYSNPIGRLLEKLTVPRKGFIGPWGHTYPEMASPLSVSWQTEEIRWWRQWLFNKDTGIMDEPMLHAFMPYRTAAENPSEPTPGRWIAESQWPPEKSVTQQFWLTQAGLKATKSTDDKLQFQGDKLVGLQKPEWLDALPNEQTQDDENSLVFDSEPLQDNLEILGYPKIQLRIAADKPVAGVAVRVTEVSPTGESWLVSYAVKNLTHRNSHENPEPLEPGHFYDVTLTLFMVAHRFKTGHCIRVAISDNLWPLTWPMSKPATLTIDTAASSLMLPAHPIESTKQNLPMAIHEHMNGRAPSLSSPVKHDEKSGYRYAVKSPKIEYLIKATGTTLSSQTSKLCEFKPDTGNVWYHQIRQGWRRGDWHCEVEATCEIKSSADTFHVKESLCAFRDGELIFTQETNESVDRYLM